jgi:hypothetical protein
MPLTALSEAQRAQALGRFTIIRPALEKEVSHKRSFVVTKECRDPSVGRYTPKLFPGASFL